MWACIEGKRASMIRIAIGLTLMMTGTPRTGTSAVVGTLSASAIANAACQFCSTMPLASARQLAMLA